MLLTICMALFGVVCVLLILVIIVQPAQGEGLAGAFGGSGSETFFGTKAGQHMNRFTIGLAVVFLALAVLLVVLYRGEQGTGDGSGESVMPKKAAQEAPALPPGGNPTPPTEKTPGDK